MVRDREMVWDGDREGGIDVDGEGDRDGVEDRDRQGRWRWAEKDEDGEIKAALVGKAPRHLQRQ